MNFETSRYTYPTSGVPLFYSSANDFNPNSVINFIDLTKSIPENDPYYNTWDILNPIETSGAEYLLPQRFRNLPSGSLLVTDKTINSTYSNYDTPLFTQYQLMYDHFSNDPFFPEGFITIRRNNETIVSPDSYIVETRNNPTESGRYNAGISGGNAWVSNLTSGNIKTVRTLLQTQKNDKAFYTIEYNKYNKGSTSEYWSELIDEVPLYDQDDSYTITSSSIIVSDNSLLSSGIPIFVTRDPRRFVKLNFNNSTSDKYKDKTWDFSFNHGNFNIHNGISSSGFIYYNTNYDTDDAKLADQVCKVTTPTIVKVPYAPILESSGTYPTYDFSKVVERMTVNGTIVSGNILSIDTQGGYIKMNRPVDQSDEVIVDYYYDNTQTMVVKNANLNPMYSTSGVIDVAASGLGVAIVPSGTDFTNVDTGDPVDADDWSNIALYNLSDVEFNNFSSSNVTGWAASPESFESLEDGGGLASGIIPSGSKFIGSFTANGVSPDSINLVDIRRTGGYKNSDIQRQDVSGWRNYADVGFMDGEPMPFAGIVIIQIPRFVKANIEKIFEADRDLEIPSVDLPRDALEASDLSITNTREKAVQQAANKYIIDTVERYIPIGTKYIIVDENMVKWDNTGGSI